MIARYTGGVVHYFLNDRLSARVTLDGAGTLIGRLAHLPFGEDLNATGVTDKHKPTSYDRDTETGNVYAVNRGYVPSIGRFNQADPYRVSGGPSDPQSWNRFSNVSNGPIGRIDPSGLLYLPVSLINIMGEFYTRDGDEIGDKIEPLPVGSFAFIPKGCHHYAFTKGLPAIVEVSREGPWFMVMVDTAKEVNLPSRILYINLIIAIPAGSASSIPKME